MKVIGPSGKVIEVTEKAFRTTYKNAGFSPVEVGEDDNEKGNAGNAGNTSDPGSTGTGTATDPGTGNADSIQAGTSEHSDQEGAGQPERLTIQQYAEDVKDRPALMDALTRLGVEFGAKDRKDDLKEQFDTVLRDRGMLPQ